MNGIDKIESLRKHLREENLEQIDKPRKPVNKAFKAKYDGDECPVCLISISKGEKVRYNSDGSLIHVNHKRKEETYEICDSCFLTKPCECD